MKGLVVARPDLFSVSQVSRFLEKDRNFITGVIQALGITFKEDATRNGKFVDRDDLARIAGVVGKIVIWSDDGIPSAHGVVRP